MLKSKLFFNGVIRAILETYLQLSISTLVSMNKVNFNGANSDITSSAATVLLLALIAGCPIFAYKFL